jgi:hypothetical protein
MTRRDPYSKGDRALELADKGLDNAAIAARLGSNPRSIASLLLTARRRRARELERAGRLSDIMGHNV